MLAAIYFLTTLSLSQQSALNDLMYLSSDKLAGRETSTQGARNAADYITNRFRHIELTPYKHAQYAHSFSYQSGFFASKQGVNIVGTLHARANSWVVITAHYDHLGSKGNRIYHGADDNASGVAAMLYLADRLKKRTLNHNYLFVATDAEETGLHGANAMVKLLLEDGVNIKLNVNLDMLAGAAKPKQLYAFYPTALRQYKQAIEVSASDANVKSTSGRHFFRYDQGSLGFSTNIKRLALESSDHYAFAKHDIPFVYFGVGTHKHYHQPSDTYKNIDTDFFINNISLVEQAVLALDKALATAE